MINAQQIIKDVKALTEKAKNSKPPSKNTVYAQSDFIDKLLQMEKQYAQKNKEQMPDFNKLVPAIEPPDASWEYKEPEVLEKEAQAYIQDMAKQKYDQIKDDAYQTEEKLRQKQLKATRQQRQELEKSKQAFSQNQMAISNKMAQQGLTHSTIREQMLDENLNRHLNAISTIRQEYQTLTDDLKKQIEMVNTQKEQAILEFNIKAAAEYEKKLGELHKEQLKALDKLIEYNNNLQNEQLKRQERIKSLEENWLLQQQEKEQEQLQKELIEGYTGEKVIEMENRYKIAKNYYINLERNRALDLINKDKEVLKPVLGLYYNRLIKEIQNKE